MVSTKKHQTAQINIEDGEIVVLAFDRVRGIEALPFVLRIVGCGYNFTEGVRSKVHTSLPPTEWILEHLEGRAKHLSHDGSYAPLSETQMQRIQEVLTEYVGPVAVVLCAEKLSTATNLESASSACSPISPSRKMLRHFEWIYYADSKPYNRTP